MGHFVLIGHIRKNWKSGLTVALISIPLSISLAVASHATPLQGIITAIWAGLAAAILGGSRFNIVGPTGALSGLIAAYAMAHGADGLALLAIVSGAIVLAAYALRLERYLIFVPSSVIHGFTLGVAVIIGFGQFNNATGLRGLAQHETFFANLLESFRNVAHAAPVTFAVFAAFFAGLFVLRRIIPRIPGAILLAPVGVLLGYLGKIDAVPLRLETLGDRFGTLAFRFFEVPHVGWTSGLASAAVSVALIGILETMLSARIADGMTGTKHDERKEMLGLGVANVVSGLMGGIPATAALARTSLNIKSGADDRASGVVNAVCVAAISIFLLRSFSYIPMAVIAAILGHVAALMIEREHFVTFYRHERASFWVAMVVAAVTVVEDPIAGILVGTAASLLMLVERLSHGQFDMVLNTYEEGIVGRVSGERTHGVLPNADVLLYSIKGKLCYVNSRAHVTRFREGLAKYAHVILRLREVSFVDLDGVEALDEIIETAEARGQHLLVTSVHPSVIGIVGELSEPFRKLEAAGKVFLRSEDALRSVGIVR